MDTTLEHLLKLPRGERIQLVEDLWDSIAREESELPVSEAKQDVLRNRKEGFLAQPSSGRLWSQVKESIRNKHD
ncbi:MAG: addiction module protein [Verrucomicrobiota bacterium]